MSYARDFYLGKKARHVGSNGAGLKTNRECLDPRLYASKAFAAGQIVLVPSAMPDVDTIPRSSQPSCKLGRGGAMIALRGIGDGELLTLEGGDDEEYDEWELDTETGEMVKVGGGLGGGKA